MIVTELSRGIKLYLLVGGRGTRLSSITNGLPKPLVDVNGKSFIERVLENISGFDITLVCSDLNYKFFQNLGVDVLNEGQLSGTGGFLSEIDLPESFYVMNGDTFYSGNLNLDCDKTTIFVSREKTTGDEGYILGKDGKVNTYIEKNIFSSGETHLVNLGIYKFYKKDLLLPDRLPISIEYDILNYIDLSYQVIETNRFDIGTPERLERFKKWCV
jgi:D-glycero-D-manno-heptose 1,7-bisphosphate phosphatase